MVASTPTTADLIEIFSNALGLPRRTVEATARHLREDGMLPAGKGGTAPPAEEKHAVILLLGLMLAAGSKAAPDAVKLYAHLPFDRVCVYQQDANGGANITDLPNDDPRVDEALMIGETFGDFLLGTIRVLGMSGDPLIDPGQISAGGALGTARASVIVNDANDAARSAYIVQFSLRPLGGGVQPDDAPRARLEHEAKVPRSIFTILRDAFAGQEPARASDAKIYELRRD